jgi:hypothetical protein
VKTVAFLLLLSSAASAQSTVTVTGTVRYEDRTYGAAGFTGTAFLPVRQAEVELLNTGPTTPQTTTDELGNFTFLNVTASATTQVRVYARRTGGQYNIVVRNNSTANAIYTVLSAPLDTTVTTTFGTIDLLQTGAGPVFNIFDCAVKSFQYLASVDPGLPATPPPLNVYWELNSANGTYFDPSVNGIFLLGLASDSDQYDDDIILHEMGHWVAYNFSRDDTLGGAHSVIDQLDPRTSWSEGWAHYWSATVRRFFPAEYANPNLQVDTFGTGNSVFDIEAPSFPTLAIMATNELAVACVLWHITDGNTLPPSGSGAIYEPEIWQTVSVQIPARANITLEDFHAGLSVVDPAIMLVVTGSTTTSGIFKEREIRYYLDDSEPNDSAGAATPLAIGSVGLTQRTFFGTLDDDWYSVSATPGTLIVETLNLGDGCNPILELYDSTGSTLLARNDDFPGDGLSARVSAPVGSNATFLVRALRSGTVVEYGYYDIRAQIGLPSLPPSDHAPYDHRCGALGLEGLGLAGLVRLFRRRRC